MDTKALRQKILDLAIRGKLVPQDPNDEPASVLLERIRAEKQQMVKDGKLKAKDLKNDTVIFVGDDNLHYEKFSDGTIKCLKDETKFFKIPKSWSFVRIRDIASVKGGKRIPKGKEFSAVPTPHAYIHVTNMKNRTITTSDLKYISDEIYETIRNYTISKTDLYLTIAGTIGLVGEVPDLLDGMNLTENAVKVTPFSINKTFLCFCLLSCFVQNQFQDKTHQVAQPKLAIERILNTIIPLPPLNEQILITNSVKTAFDLVDCVEKQNIALGEIITKTKSKILDLAIRGKLVPQDPNDEPASVLLERIHQEKEGLIKAGKLKRDKRESVIFRGEDNSYYEKFSDGTITSIERELPFEIPNGWSWCRLKNISTTNIGLTYHPQDVSSTGTTVLRSNNIINNNIDYSELIKVKCTIKENQFLHKNDILICARNGSKNLVGKCAVYAGETNTVSFGAFMTTLRTPFYEYIFNYLQTDCFRRYFHGDDSKQINQVTQEILRESLVPIPPLREQVLITENINKTMKFLDLIVYTSI